MHKRCAAKYKLGLALSGLKSHPSLACMRVCIYPRRRGAGGRGCVRGGGWTPARIYEIMTPLEVYKSSWGRLHFMDVLLSCFATIAACSVERRCP